MTPKSNSGRAASGRSPLCRNKSPPKMTTIRIGARSKSFASGARVSERKLPRVMAAAYSDNQGSFFSSRAGDDATASVRGAGTGAALRSLPEVNCPVYKRTVVR